jgi:hypothetical protein
VEFRYCAGFIWHNGFSRSWTDAAMKKEFG